MANKKRPTYSNIYSIINACLSKGRILKNNEYIIINNISFHISNIIDVWYKKNFPEAVNVNKILEKMCTEKQVVPLQLKQNIFYFILIH